MPLTTTQQTEAYRFFAIAFNAAPGVEYMNQIAAAYEGGASTKQIVNEFVKKSVFTNVYPNFLTNEQFAARLIDNVVGAAATDAAKTEAKADVVAALTAGSSRGDVIFQIFTNLSALSGDAKWGDMATKMANQVAVSRYYTETLLKTSTDIATLQAVLAGVNQSTDITTAALEARLNPPASLTIALNTGIDSGAAFTGGAGNDTFLGSNAAGTVTLTSLDSIDGGAGSDTLNITTTAAIDTTAPVGYAVKSIENVNLVSGAGVTVDTRATASGWSAAAVENLNVTSIGASSVSAAATTNVTAANTGSTSTLAVTGGNAVNVTVTGTAGAVTIDGSAGAVSVSQATAGAITIGGTTAVKGSVAVTSTAQGAGNIAIDGGTSVNVNSTTTSTGAITVGAATAPTGAVSVTETLKGTGALSGGAIAVTGGTSVNVTVNASQATNNTSTTVGAITVTGTAATTSVTVAGTPVVSAAATNAGTTESNVATFAALAAGASVTVGGLTFVAGAGGTTAAQTAAAFAGLASGATSGASTKGTYSGTLTGWSTGTVSTADVVFTSSTARSNVTDLAQVTTGQTTAGVTFVKIDGAAATGRGGIIANTITVNDAVTSNTATTASTITSITASDYTTLTVDNNNLSSLSLTRGSGNVTIDNTSARTSPTTTLALALNGVSGGTLDDADVWTALNVTTSGANSTLANITSTSVATLTVSGDKALTLTSAAGLSGLKSVTVSGSAGLSANLSALVTGGSVNASGTSGANTITVKSTVATYSGGTGVDTVTTTTDGVSKAISLGDGDDSLTIGDGITTLTAAVTGGAGTDTLVMRSVDAQAAGSDLGFVTNLSGFERLTLTAGGGSVDVSKFGPGNDVTITATASTAITAVPASNKVTVNGAQAGTLTVTGADVTGTADVLNIVQTNATGGTLAAAGYETINLTSSVASGVITLSSAALKTLNISGTRSTTVTLDAANVNATTIDASSNSGGVTITSVSTKAATITGGSGNDALTMKPGTTTAEVLIGNAGNDTLTSNAGLGMMTGGSGFDLFVVGGVGASKNVFTTITDAAVGDSIQLAANTGTETFNATALVLGDTASFADYCNLAAASPTGATNGVISYFYFGGNTYVVEDLSNSTTFVDGIDVIVKLTGIINLSGSSLQGVNGNILLIGPVAG